MEELAFRRNNHVNKGSDVNGTASRAGEREAQTGGGQGSNHLPLPPRRPTDNIAPRISELTQGLRLPTQLKDRLATARSEHDIQDIIHDEVIVAGKSGKMRDTLAQRVGMLDNEGRPTAMADEVSARKTPAGEQAPTPATDAAFLQRWKDEVKTTGQKDPAVRALKPTSEADAQTQIYRALGDQGVKSDADGLEKLAQKYGVLDDNRQLTPLALEIAKRDPIQTEVAVKAAQAQGYKGAAASMFDRGVQHYVDGKETITKFDSTRQGEAYQAGVKWAEETNSVPRGALKKYEPSAYTGEVTEEQRALGQKVEVKKAEIPPEVRQGQLVNEAIDNIGLHPSKDEVDIAQLKSMVRSGDIDGAMNRLREVQRGDAAVQRKDEARYYKTGHGALAHAAAREPIKGETIIPGAPRAPREAELVPTKATTRAEAEKAIRKHLLMQSVEEAHRAGDITGVDKIRLVSKLAKGRLADVEKEVGTPSSRMAERARSDADRVERRAELNHILQEMLDQAAKEAEVPELQVDQDGVLRSPRRANGVQSNAEMFAAIAHNPNDPRAVIDHLQSLGGDIGTMVERFRKYVPEDIRFVLVHPEEMARIGREEGWNFPAAALYDHRTHTVVVDAYQTEPRIVLHELGHAIVSGHIYNRTEIGQEMERTFNQLKKYITEGDYAATNADEFFAEFLARKDLRDYIQRATTKNIFQRIWDAILSAFGKPPRGVVEHVLSLAEAAGGDRLFMYDNLNPMAAAPPRVAAHVKDQVGSIVDAVDKHVDTEGLKGILRRSQLYATTIHHITEHFGSWFDLKREDGTVVNGVKHREATTDFREAIQQRYAQLMGDPMDRAYALDHTDKKSFNNIQTVLKASEFGIHYARPWDAQTKEVRENPALKARWQEFHDAYRSLQAKGHAGIVDDLKKFNDVQMLAQTALALHDRVSSDKVMGGRYQRSRENPMYRFMDEQAREGHGLRAHTSSGTARSTIRSQHSGRGQRLRHHAARSEAVVAR
jgi:hypothetical protein